MINFVIPCLLGLEGPISEELRLMDIENVAAENGRVLFSGDEYTLARANIRSRYAERVQILVGSFEAYSFEDLFQGVKSLPWEDWISERDAFPVKGYSINSTLFSVSDCQSIIKKAVVERLRQNYKTAWFEETGAVRQIQFSIMKDRVSMLIDTSGYGLHKRGYRPQSAEAPLKETMAAALCRLSRLRTYHTLYDPMCGSGTIIIEGALMAMNIAPGIGRSFSAERWDNIPESVWRRERELAKSLEKRDCDFFAYGSDIDGKAIEIAKINSQRAGVADKVSFEVGDVKNFSPKTERGTLICNPPYGERLGDVCEAERLYSVMGQAFTPKKGWSYSVICPSETFEKSFGRKADKRRKLYNGMIKCDLYMYYK
ncbi:MAG: class I SAM-dependent RNA methyltransferase [Oscillospiraceae bacterium]|nr:class I SAM-dependent RNA methyltransferase [Oscillospiraceae bacterium]